MILDAKISRKHGLSGRTCRDYRTGTVGLFLAVSLARANIPTIVVETGGYVADTSRSGQTAVSLGRPHSGVTLGEHLV